MNPVMFWRKTSGIRRWRAQLDEVGALERRLAEQDAVVGDDPDRLAVEMREAGDQRLAVERLELVEAAAVDEPGDHLADRRAAGGDRSGPQRRGGRCPRRVAAGRDRRRLGIVPIPGWRGRPAVQVRDDRPAQREGVLVVERLVVGHAADSGVDVGTAELLRA